MRFNTALLHNGTSKTGPTLEPIYQSTAFQYGTAEELEQVFCGNEFGYIYTRINNPTLLALEKRLAALEAGLGAVVCASGMAAISLALLNIVEAGGEIVAASGMYGGTLSLFKEFERYGITTHLVKDDAVSSFTEYINEKTRVLFIESIGNPKLNVPDIRALSELAHQHSIVLVVDNTAASPYIVRPLELGADIVVHSTSKYINGSGNSIGGVVICGAKTKWDLAKYPALAEYQKFGPFAYLARLRKGMLTDFGSCQSPFNAYLNSIGLETLGLRMERICTNALKLAEFLETQPKVVEVNYPGLPGRVGHVVAKEQFSGKFGGILTLRLGSKESAYRLINGLQYVSNLANIGDVRTLAIHPASTLCLTHSTEEQAQMGVFEDLVRISVGIEDIEDLQHDFAQALEGNFFNSKTE